MTFWVVRSTAYLIPLYIFLHFLSKYVHNLNNISSFPIENNWKIMKLQNSLYALKSYDFQHSTQRTVMIYSLILYFFFWQKRMFSNENSATNYWQIKNTIWKCLPHSESQHCMHINLQSDLLLTFFFFTEFDWKCQVPSAFNAHSSYTTHRKRFLFSTSNIQFYHFDIIQQHVITVIAL